MARRIGSKISLVNSADKALQDGVRQRGDTTFCSGYLRLDRHTDRQKDRQTDRQNEFSVLFRLAFILCKDLYPVHVKYLYNPCT